MINLLRGRDSGLNIPGLSLHSYHYAPQIREYFVSLPHLLAMIPLSPTGSWEAAGPYIALRRTSHEEDVSLIKNGRGERIRTSDPLLPKQMRYQAALRPDLALPV